MNLNNLNNINLYDENGDKIILPLPVPKELILLEEELQLVNQVFWFSQVLASQELFNCLENMPTGAGTGTGTGTESGIKKMIQKKEKKVL